MAGVHDLYLRSLISGGNAMSVHTVLTDDNEHDAVMKRVHEFVTENFKIAHVKVQTECAGYADYETHL